MFCAPQINEALRITSVAPYGGEALPPLKNVSGVVFTGSGVAWCVDDPRAEALEGAMRAVFAARLPAYGSCNGLQIHLHWFDSSYHYRGVRKCYLDKHLWLQTYMRVV